MGNWVVSWYVNSSHDDGTAKAVRFDNVTEDYVDGYILALVEQAIAKGTVIKQRL